MDVEKTDALLNAKSVCIIMIIFVFVIKFLYLKNKEENVLLYITI